MFAIRGRKTDHLADGRQPHQRQTLGAMSTLDLPFRTTARTTIIAGQVLLSALRTFSGLAVILGAVLFLIFSDGNRPASSSPAAEQPGPQVSAVGARLAGSPLLMFYLVATQAEADLAAADDYDNWASGDRAASEKRVHILFARDSAEEAAAHQMILREIAARPPSVVGIVDWRGAD